MRETTMERYLFLLKEADPETKTEVIETLNDKIEISGWLSRNIMWQNLIDSNFSWTSDDLETMLLCWDGPLSVVGYKWILEHPELSFKNLARIGYRATHGTWSIAKADPPGQRALKALEEVALKEDATQANLHAVYNLTRSFWQVPNPSNRLSVAVGDYNRLLGLLINPERGGSPARVEIFNRLHRDGWNGKLTELVEASVSLA